MVIMVNSCRDNRHQLECKKEEMAANQMAIFHFGQENYNRILVGL